MHGEGFTVGGMAKGSGMIHPNLATMLAVVTTDYPLEPGEPLDFLRPAVEESFNSISVDGECSTNDAVVLLSSCEGERSGDDARSPTRCTPSAPTSRGRSSPTERARRVVAEISVTGAASQDEAKAVARRIATSPLVKTALFGKDANWGRVLAAAGSAPFNGGYAQLDPSLVTLCYNGTKVLDRGAPQGVEPDVDGAACAIDLDLGLGDGERAVPHDRPVLRLRPHQRGLPLVTRPIVVKCGGAVAESAAELILELADAEPVVVVHGAGPQISAEMERRGLEVQFVGGRRVTSREALEVVRESMARSTRRSARRSASRRCRSSATRSACTRCRFRCSEWSAIRSRARRTSSSPRSRRS